jgi:short-subunit dehydrogenase
MKKTILIVGMGTGMSLGMAQKFGKEGFQVGMISRNADKLDNFRQQLNEQGITAAYATADVAEADQLLAAIDALKAKLGAAHVLHYNAVDARMKPLLEESVEDLTRGFRISVANVLTATRAVLPDLRFNQGAVLLTGGGTALSPNPDIATISLGKAGLRSLALQLHQVLQKEGVFVGTLTVNGWISTESATHSPALLADKFWELYQSRDKAELVY